MSRVTVASAIFAGIGAKFSSGRLKSLLSYGLIQSTYMPAIFEITDAMYGSLSISREYC